MKYLIEHGVDVNQIVENHDEYPDKIIPIYKNYHYNFNSLLDYYWLFQFFCTSKLRGKKLIKVLRMILVKVYAKLYVTIHFFYH